MNHPQVFISLPLYTPAIHLRFSSTRLSQSPDHHHRRRPLTTIAAHHRRPPPLITKPEQKLWSHQSRLVAFPTQMTRKLGCNSRPTAKLSSVTAPLRGREELSATRDQVAELKEEVLQGEYLRKRLHNRVQELKGNIRVYCRIRPLLEEEIKKKGDSDVHHINVLSESSLELLKGNVGEEEEEVV
ncbi:Spindle pole body-associated protein Vik1/Cik1 microtubule binding domain [Trinorchestia longiramus]|nr:Spindle pole body-associated protein Vik1/Cik1 microtubule binding domain [Trinorchestia longiramus]